jgi:hypothetical protein
MPPLTQDSCLCTVCFQRFFEEGELRRHYFSSHGDEEDLPKEEGREGGDEDNTEEEACKEVSEPLDVQFPIR